MLQMKNFFLFSFSVSMLFACGAGGFYLLKHETNQGKSATAPAIAEENKGRLNESSRHKQLLDIFWCLIDLAEETKKYFNAGFAFNKVNSSNVDSFVQNQVNKYAFMKANFRHISKRLDALADGDKIVKEMSVISMNLSTFCKCYIDGIILFSQGINTLNASAKISENWSNFYRDWSELLSLTLNFISKCKVFLDQKEKTEISANLLSRFGQNINKFKQVYYRESPEKAFGLKFADGGWLPVTIWFSLNTVENKSAIN